LELDEVFLRILLLRSACFLSGAALNHQQLCFSCGVFGRLDYGEGVELGGRGRSVGDSEETRVEWWGRRESGCDVDDEGFVVLPIIATCIWVDDGRLK